MYEVLAGDQQATWREQKKNDGVGTPSADDFVFLPSRSPKRSQRHRINSAVGWYQKRSRPAKGPWHKYYTRCRWDVKRVA